MNNLLMFIATVLVLVISALFAAPLFVDWNDYREVFEQQASRLVGREVNVGGDVSLTFLPKPVLRFENINVADAQGGFDAPFLSARSLTVWLSVPPLLRGVVEARDVALDEPILNLRIGPDGQGNWGDVGRPDVSLPFMPREVALDSFRIIDGTVMIARGSEPPHLTLDHLDGELSARSLQGPYKFAGAFDVGGETQQLKFSTARQEANEGTRLRAQLVNDGGMASYTIDGELTGFNASPRFTGAFEARFTDPEAETAAKGEPQQEAAAPVLAQPPLQVKAQVEAGPERAKFTGIEVAIRRSNKPQTITGEMDVAYGGELALSGALASRWLDVDSLIMGAPEGTEPAGPMAMVSRLAARLLGVAASVHELNVDISVEQAVLAGDLLHDVSAGVTGGNGGVAIDSFSARLPGEAELTVTGDLTARDGAPVFKGRGEVKGEKLNSLLGWAGLETGSTVAAGEGGFSLSGAVSAAPGAFAIEDATGRLFRSRFSGALRYSGGERRRFDLTLKSDRLDIGRLGGAWVEKLTIPALLRGGEAGGGGKTDGDAGPGWLEGAQARLDVDIGAVTLPGIGESSLVAGVDIDGGDVSIRELRLVSNEGLRILAKGSLTGLDGTPSGSIDMTANADTTQGMQALARLFELEGVAEAEAWRLRAMTPAALTGSIRSAGGGRRGLSAEVSGKLGGNDVKLAASLDGKPAEWRDGTVALDARLEAASARALLTQLSSGVREHDLALFENDGGVLSLKAAGVPADGMEASLDFAGGGIVFAANGTLTAGAEALRFSGDAALDAKNGAALLTLAGAHLSPGHSSARLDLEADLRSAGRAFEITDLSGTVGDVTLSGSADLDLGAERPRAELDLVASAASLPFLFEPLIGWNAPAASATGAVRGVTRSQSFWPDEAFDAGLLNSFDGALKLKAKSLRVAGPLALADASLDASLEDGTLEIRRIEGRILGGSVAGQAKFIAEAGGLTFKAGAGARGLKLDRIIGGEDLARGKMDVELEVQAQGLSPRGLAAGLSGKGRLTFSEGRIARLEPATPKKAAARLAADDASDEDKLLAAIRRELASGSFAFRPFEADIAVRNGVARVEKVKLGNPDGSAVVTTFLEFATLKLDSEWLLVSGEAQDEEAPRITLAFAGPLEDIGEMKPAIDAGALQRYATIRRMEKDVETLENLEVPGAPKRRKPEPESEQKENASAAAAPVPRGAPEPADKAPAPSAGQTPALVGDAVVSRPLPPAAPAQPAEPAPPPAATAPQPFQEQRQPQPPPQQQQQPGSALPWSGQPQPSPYGRQPHYDPRQAYDPRQQQYRQQYQQPVTPPAAIPQPQAEPQPQSEPRRSEQEWNPFRQDF